MYFRWNFEKNSNLKRTKPIFWILQVDGAIHNQNGETVYHLKGSWDQKLEGWPAAPPDVKPVLLWQRNTPPQSANAMYNFSKMAIELNEMEANLAPTDSRFRPDLRLMELGEWDTASDLKHLLESSHRTSLISGEPRLRENQARRSVSIGLWFSFIPFSEAS